MGVIGDFTNFSLLWSLLVSLEFPSFNINISIMLDWPIGCVGVNFATISSFLCQLNFMFSTFFMHLSSLYKIYPIDTFPFSLASTRNLAFILLCIGYSIDFPCPKSLFSHLFSGRYYGQFLRCHSWRCTTLSSVTLNHDIRSKKRYRTFKCNKTLCYNSSNYFFRR